MSDHVIIVGVNRGRERVAASEIKQMLGRQGRRHDGLAYSSDIILHDEDYEIENELEAPENYDAISRMSEVRKFCFCVLPEIVNGRIHNKDGLKDFYSRSLASFQGKEIDFEKVCQYLDSRGAISRCKNEFEDTFCPFINGVIASRLYMEVGDVFRLRENFERVFRGDSVSDGAIAWALGNVETIRVSGSFGENNELLYSFRSELPQEYDCEDGCVTTSALWWAMLGNCPAGKQMSNDVRKLKRAWGKIKTVISFVKSVPKGAVEELDLRIRRNLRKELVPFFSSDGMTKWRAEGLLRLGYSNAHGTENIELEDE